MGYVSSVSATVYRVVREGAKTRLVPIGTACVGEDGKTLAIEVEETMTIGPDTPLLVKGV